MTFIVATTSLPVDRPNADRLERRTLVPIHLGHSDLYNVGILTLFTERVELCSCFIFLFLLQNFHSCIMDTVAQVS